MGNMKRYKPPQSARELLERYENGENYFVGAKADGLSMVDLDGGHLLGVNLSQARIRDMDVGDMELSHVSFRDSDISGLDAYGAGFTSCDFRNANLDFCNISYSSLKRCMFDNASFIHSKFLSVAFDGGRCFGAGFSDTAFIDADIRPFCDAEYPEQHSFGVHVDYKTIVRSLLSPKGLSQNNRNHRAAWARISLGASE